MLKTLFKSKSEMVILDNGIVDPKDDEFRQIAAVHSSGVCYVADGYRHDDFFLEIKTKNVKAGTFPAITGYEKRTLEEIRDLYKLVGSIGHGATQEQTSTSGAQRLMLLIEQAARARASDIKIYQHETETILRIRIAGREFPACKPWTPEEGIKAQNYAFDARDDGSGEATLKDNEFQSFSISSKKKFKLPDTVIKLRGQRGYMASDTKNGSWMVFRLFYKEDNETGTFDDLGFDREVSEAFADARAFVDGCVIVGGVTGDGKSTTLIRSIERLYDEHDGQVGISTLEDPVEYRVKRDGIIQIPIKSAGDAVDLTANYRDALRNFVRINPDVGVISEIRDGDAARQVLQFVTSGHATYTTLHVQSANGILFRLIDLGVRPAELSQMGVIRLLVKQSLPPMLCEHCKIKLCDATLSETSQRHLELLMPYKDQIYTRNVQGCEHCVGSDPSEFTALAWAGYRRQIAVAEIIIPDETYFSFVRAEDANGARQHWLKPVDEGGLGGITIQQKLTQLVIDGTLDPTDAVRLKGDLSQTLNSSQLGRLRWKESA